MTKKQTSTSSKGTCDKIYKAIRRVSHCPRSSKPLTAPGSVPLSPELKKTTTEPISTEFPVHFNHPVSATPTQQKEQTVKTHIASRTESLSPVIVPRVASKTKQVKPRSERAAPAQEGTDDKFSSYLDRAGAKIRTTSKVGVGVGVGVGGDGGVGDGGGGGRSVSRRDSFNDKISHFINRAKIKFITTSSVGGGGRSVSFK
ncbi:Sister chromatid cohesion protein [Actinidia chinensis var. chinensis]|uniref:Sister chromatid cohesion protein n=1 Tax=Actinidia chinensis var. chinensis TaxID=1590841 RepID=A0A2R6P6D2_ACTCC|nr:Sister chromatid cohesion protein [Actinidia chinensis var. chinensis]